MQNFIIDYLRSAQKVKNRRNDNLENEAPTETVEHLLLECPNLLRVESSHARSLSLVDGFRRGRVPTLVDPDLHVATWSRSGECFGDGFRNDRICRRNGAGDAKFGFEVAQAVNCLGVLVGCSHLDLTQSEQEGAENYFGLTGRATISLLVVVTGDTVLLGNLDLLAKCGLDARMEKVRVVRNGWRIGKRRGRRWWRG